MNKLFNLIVLAVLMSMFAWNAAANDYRVHTSKNLATKLEKITQEEREKITQITLEASVSGADLGHLVKTFPNATKLFYNAATVDLSGLKDGELNQITDFFVYPGTFTKQNLEDLVRVDSELRHLSLNGHLGADSDADFEAIEKASKLETLSLDGNFDGNVVLFLLEIPGLKKVDITTDLVINTDNPEEMEPMELFYEEYTKMHGHEISIRIKESKKGNKVVFAKNWPK